jgi:hypothetical protein
MLLFIFAVMQNTKRQFQQNQQNNKFNKFQNQKLIQRFCNESNQTVLKFRQVLTHDQTLEYVVEMTVKIPHHDIHSATWSCECKVTNLQEPSVRCATNVYPRPFQPTGAWGLLDHLKNRYDCLVKIEMQHAHSGPAELQFTQTSSNGLQQAQLGSTELQQAQIGSAELQNAQIESVETLRSLSSLSESIETLDFSDSPEFITLE